MGITAIQTPDNFISDNVLGLSDDILMAMTVSAREAQKYVPLDCIDDPAASRAATISLGTLNTKKMEGNPSELAMALRAHFEREGLIVPSPWFADRMPKPEKAPTLDELVVE